MWQAKIYTLYQEIFPGPLSIGLYGKALEKKTLEFKSCKY
jgi:tRNA (guanine37-N1)-methyltransferase